MNDYEAERIAAAINVLRPDWPAKSLVTLMQRPELAHKPRRDIAVAFAWVACESNTANPGRVLEAGPWWKAAAIESPASTHRIPPKKADECQTHLGQWASNCAGCAADARAALPYGHTEDDVTHTTPADSRAGIETCRAALRSGKEPL